VRHRTKVQIARIVPSVPLTKVWHIDEGVRHADAAHLVSVVRARQFYATILPLYAGRLGFGAVRVCADDARRTLEIGSSSGAVAPVNRNHQYYRDCGVGSVGSCQER